MSTRVLLVVLVALALGSGAAWAQTPQTIVIDGVNDFLPGNLVEDDGDDTEHPNIDLGEVYVTNDAVNLYFGMEHDEDGWTTVQLGIAIDVGTADGGITDPWGRAIEWSLAPNKPDFIYYVNLDNNWQAGYLWDGEAWVTITEGTASLGWDTSTGFRELGVMLGSLGVGVGDPVNYEMWVTQDGGNKGPLDLLADDFTQLSTPDFTMWETPAPIPLTMMLTHTVLAAADPDPPLVNDVKPTAYPVDSFFDVYFDEPVDEATAEMAGNYVLTGGAVAANVIAAERDASTPSIVHLTFDTPLTAAATLYTLTVTGVEDLAGNAIVDDGVGNVSCFMLKDVLFRGLFGPFLAGQTPPFEFSVEGGLVPLTWNLCDTGMMVDTGVDDIWEYATTFCVTGDCVGGTASESFEWKFVFNCTDYENLPNRVHTLDLANGASDIVEAWWNDQDPTAFTAHDIDVEFFVDMNESGWMAGDVVGLNGNVLPLTHDVPSLTVLVDDGTGNDAVAGDGIFSALVTFPEESLKNVDYKFLLNDDYECDGQGDRSVFLNDEMYDVVGGELGPLTLPVVRYDFCNSIWRAVEVVFSVDFNGTAWEDIGPEDVVAVNGTPNNAEPPTFDWTIPSLNVMNDDGVWPDAVAGDKVYAVAVVFPDTSTQNIEYKYLLNDEYECTDQGNRHVALDPDNYDDAGNPQVLESDVFGNCGVSPVPAGFSVRLQLSQNLPNPFNPSTTIRFDVPRAGAGSLRVYNLRGELVRTLKSGQFNEGPDAVVWNGRSDRGAVVGSGVYFYRLEVGTDSVTRRMVMLK